jgi:hypothetical protein
MSKKEIAAKAVLVAAPFFLVCALFAESSEWQGCYSILEELLLRSSQFLCHMLATSVIAQYLMSLFERYFIKILLIATTTLNCAKLIGI